MKKSEECALDILEREMYRNFYTPRAKNSMMNINGRDGKGKA